MSHWLDPVRRVLDTAPSTRRVFFRDDDAGWNGPALYRLLDLFAFRGTTIDLAVIPAAVDRGLTARLHPRLARGEVRIHQHGWNHTNHEAEGRRCEFGPSRDLDGQRRSLMAGAERLAATFGPDVDPVFTPPWNRCTPATGQLLVELGWRVLSRDHTAALLGLAGLAEIPVTFDWFGRTGKVPWDQAERGRRIAASLAANGPGTPGTATGIMLHHAVSGPDDLAAIDQLLALLSGHRAVVATTVVALAAEITATPAAERTVATS